MEVTIDDEAKTRVRHVYTVSAPIAGKVLRISNPLGSQDMSLHVGDRVVANETVVAVMQPMAPSFLDIRSREELQAGLTAAEAQPSNWQKRKCGGLRLRSNSRGASFAALRHLCARMQFPRRHWRRRSWMSRRTKRLWRAPKLSSMSDAANLAMATARLIDPSSADAPANPTCCIQLRAPATGRVLKVDQESEGVVAAGTPLIEIGDPLDLEVVAELLSTDAVQIKAGATVRIDGWGGPPLRGRVTRVEPEGFVKVSALGIEEQRVRAIIDFVDPPEAWSALGNDFRVVVHVTLWNADDALVVPVAALFRQGDDWAVFADRNGRARLTVAKIGHRNSRMAEVLSGLSAGDQVVLHPSDRIKDGVAVSGTGC